MGFIKLDEYFALELPDFDLTKFTREMGEANPVWKILLRALTVLLGFAISMVYSKKAFAWLITWLTNMKLSFYNRRSTKMEDLNNSMVPVRKTLFTETVSTPEKVPVNEYQKDHPIVHSENEFDVSSTAIENLSKKLHKKLLREDVSMRVELLEAEKRLHTKNKQVRELRKMLHEVSENAELDRTRLREAQTEIFKSRSIAPRKRTPFFEKTFANSTGNSSLTLEEGGLMSKIQLIHLEDQINKLKNLHLSEVSTLNSEMSQKDNLIEKLNEKIAEDKSNKTHQLSSISEHHEEDSDTEHMSKNEVERTRKSEGSLEQIKQDNDRLIRENKLLVSILSNIQLHICEMAQENKQLGSDLCKVQMRITEGFCDLLAVLAQVRPHERSG